MWVDFTLSNMKSLNPKWTINSYEAMRGRKDLLQRAWEATRLWSILQRTFQPTANVPRAYEEPTSDNEEPHMLQRVNTPPRTAKLIWRGVILTKQNQIMDKLPRL